MGRSASHSAERQVGGLYAEGHSCLSLSRVCRLGWDGRKMSTKYLLRCSQVQSVWLERWNHISCIEGPEANTYSFSRAFLRSSASAASCAAYEVGHIEYCRRLVRRKHKSFGNALLPRRPCISSSPLETWRSRAYFSMLWSDIVYASQRRQDPSSDPSAGTQLNGSDENICRLQSKRRGY